MNKGGIWIHTNIIVYRLRAQNLTVVAPMPEQVGTLTVHFPEVQNDFLSNCDKVQCSEKYFKCPTSYCIPKRHECNAIWNCTGGRDEIHCSNRSCTGKFKCHNSSICISKESICDGILDCPFYDDDTFCNLPICPIHCVCLLYSINCQKLSLRSATQLYRRKSVPYVYVRNIFKRYISVVVANILCE